MAGREDVLHRVRQALAGLDLGQAVLALDDDGTLTLEGDAASLAAKKLALERAAAVPEVVGIVDRLHVRPAQAMGDREIRDHLANALLGEPALGDCALTAWDKGEATPLRRPDDAAGRIELAVADGVVTLDGEVPSLARKRLAGVLAWWVPGSRDVINGIAVEPPEDDTAGAIEDAVTAALEKDPFVNASQVRISVGNAVVRLTGVVPTDSEREMAEFDAWAVFGVDGVINEIEVRR